MAEWKEIGPASASNGGISNNAAGGTKPVIAIDRQGRPVVVWKAEADALRWGLGTHRFRGEPEPDSRGVAFRLCPRASASFARRRDSSFGIGV
jgi:hypothetical protein